MNSFFYKLAAKVFRSSRNTLAAAGKSDRGLVREHNEDYYSITTTANLFIVADGMGGHNAGEVASRMACDSVQAYFSPLTCRKISGNREEIQHALITALHHANDQVMTAAEASNTCSGMGTTILVALVDNNTVHLCHVGDSRAYLADGEGIKRLTRDDSYVEQTGTSTPEKPAAQRHVLTRAIGFPFPEDPHYNSFPLNHGDKLLMCSDGLWNMLDDRQIFMVLSAADSPAQACEQLVTLANQAGGSDNITTIVAFC